MSNGNVRNRVEQLCYREIFSYKQRICELERALDELAKNEKRKIRREKVAHHIRALIRNIYFS